MSCTEFEFNDIAYVKVDIIALQEIYKPYAKNGKNFYTFILIDFITWRQIIITMSSN